MLVMLSSDVGLLHHLFSHPCCPVKLSILRFRVGVPYKARSKTTREEFSSHPSHSP